MSVAQWDSNFGGKDCPSPGYLWGHLTSKPKVGLEKDFPPPPRKTPVNMGVHPAILAAWHDP